MHETHSPVLDPDPESSLDLLRLAQAGDTHALNTLITRYLPRVRLWASRQLPPRARGMVDTWDLVQETLSRAFRNIGRLEFRDIGALRAFLRQVLLNEVRQAIRRAASRLPPAEADAAEAAVAIAAPGPSPLEQAIGAEKLERYEQALARLRPKDRELIIARIELGLTYPEIAEMFGYPTANAARMAVERALKRLLKEMGESGNAPR